MSERFAIAVRWPDDSRPYLVHLEKPYFVAEVRRCADSILFVTTLNTDHLLQFAHLWEELLPAASRFFTSTLDVSASTVRFLKGNHGREFPRYLMAKTGSGKTYIVEPDHPAPLVEVKEPARSVPASNPGCRFDTVTQWRLAQMRKYYQQFLERQRTGEPATLVLPNVP